MWDTCPEPRLLAFTLENLSGFDQNLVRCLNMTVLYSVQIGEAKSICGTHVQSWTLELKARVHTI
jgi:hypothetical protein